MPNWYVEFGEIILNKKLKALEFYSAEMRLWPHTRSYEAVATVEMTSLRFRTYMIPIGPPTIITTPRI